ncbi:FAD-dependent oxidoreductase [Brevibacterium album]|uniref:oxidoreductase n=1 Tax=Brevibacterium album TaxID=417948 RepID=UPI000412F830|nr:FAD-dependent oxidoreductase [Brevibacterium album]
MKHDPILQPTTFAGIPLRNRLISTSHEPSYAEDGMPGDRYRAYHVEKARGGLGMTMIGGSAVVSADSPGSFGNIDLSTDAVVPWLAKLADECRAEGVPVMIQVTHLGARTTNFTDDGLPLIAPSRYREPAHRSFAKEAEGFDLDRIAADYAAAARRVRDAGLAGLELQHWGHLLDSFVSPWINHREDEYGGSLENRLRFPLRVIDAVREAVGPDFVIGIRMSMDEQRPDGIDEAAAIEIAQVYASHGIRFLSLTAGTIGTDAALAHSIPGMGTPSAPFLDLCGRVRAATGLPLMHAGRITDAATARHALEHGLVDLVGMTRPQLADPHLANKLAEDREDDIRPCVGANACLDAIYVSGAAQCVHNAATGRELTLPHEVPAAPRELRRRVVVVGAGAAGLEAARACAARGHEVTVLEANSAPGGQVAIAARSERRRDLIGIVDWRMQQALKHGAEFRFDTYAEAEDVLALEPDAVIVATGGLPDTAVCTGSERALDVWDVMTETPPTGRVLVYDDHGSYPALDAVERMVRAGAQVTYCSPERTVGIDVGGMNSPAYLTLFGEHGVRVRLMERLVGLEEGGAALTAVLRHEYAGTEERLDFDAVVIDHGTVPEDELYRELLAGSRNHGEMPQAALLDPLSHRREQEGSMLGAGASSDAASSASGAASSAEDGGYELYRVGDAVTSRNIHAAVLDALRISMLV